MTLPADHPLRQELHHEVHARPSEALQAPLRVSYLALLSEPSAAAKEWEHLKALAAGLGASLPAAPVTHFSGQLGPLRLKFERHSEFTRYKVMVPGGEGAPFSRTALEALPGDWVQGLSGSLLVAAHAELLPAAALPGGADAISAACFEGNVLVGAKVADGAGEAYTDFQLHQGHGRFLVLDRSLTARQAGRTLQRLLELETYRMLALLALPVARELGPLLSSAEGELSEITARLAQATEADEPVLLDRLTRLEATLERAQAGNAFRFGAAAAYHELVQRRIAELREARLPGLQTFQEFTERRLAPAMNTVRAAASRQEALSVRAGRATQLLSTRVDLTRERQNLAILASMDRRSAVQLRLQETVEGLSAAAITYYIVGLVGYAAKGAKVAGLPVNPELLMAVAIPAVLAMVVLGVRQVRKRLAAH